MMTSPSVSSAQQEKEKEKEMEEVVEEEEEEQPKILKLVNRKWKALPEEGEKDVYIRDPKLKEGHMGDLDKKSIVQLQEILERQDRILNNRFLSSKLKDKGKRLRETRQKVAEALERALDHKKRAETRTAAAGTAAADINAMEWKSRRKPQSKQQELDSDDDEEEEEEEREDRLDPLKLMAYHSSSVKKPAQSRRRDKEGKEEEEDAEDPTKAIVQELMQLDLQDAAQEESQSQSQSRSSASCEFRDTRSQKLEEMRRRNGPVRDSFKPFRPIDNPQPIPGVVHHTARPTTTTTVCIPLQEALQLEREYLIKEKERALSDTKEQLGKRKTKKIGLPPAAASSLKYRDANMNRHILDSDEDEESDSSSDFNDYGDE